MFVHEFEQKRYKLQGFYLGSPKLGCTGVNFFFLKNALVLCLLVFCCALYACGIHGIQILWTWSYT